MSEQTMVERVARKICGAQPHMRTLMQLNVTDWLTEIDYCWEACVPEAHAAIAAMRAPTLEMHNRAAMSQHQSRAPVISFNHDGVLRIDWSPADPTGIWFTMIDAALNEEEA